MSIRLIALDIDKTLINDDYEIPQVNIDTVKKAVAAGVHVVLNSGRFNASTRIFVEQLGIKCIVPSTGGALLETYDGEIIKDYTIDSKTAVAIFDIIRKYNHYPIVFKRDSWCIETGYTYWYDYETRAARIRGSYCNTLEYLSANCPNKMLIPSNDPEVLSNISREVNEAFGDTIDNYLSSPRYLEIMPKGVSKGTAIIDVMNYYGLTKDEVLAVGDYYNDIDMFREAGHVATVMNAPDDIKKLAEYVSPLDNNHGAAADVIRHFVNI